MIISKIDSAIKVFENECKYPGNGHVLLNDIFGELVSYFFEYSTFAFQAINRARDLLDKYEILIGEAFELKNHHIRQAYFDVIVSELKLIKNLVKGVYIPK
ncbi:hypothetical protein HPMBJEAJ_00129 [Aeromonas phage avDM6]|nr:hypothetical protein HPMBJEAJ_00129 [Aeromonas phage avDM6]